MSEIGHTLEAPIWGVSAEFASAGGMVAALEFLRDRGLGRLDAFSPVPVPAASAALRLQREHFSWFALAGVLCGGAGMMGLCLYATVYSYPFDIGGRPLVSWPAFVVPSFSFAMLTGTLAAMTAFLVFNRLPRLNHPAFNIPDFGRVTEDRFFVVVEARDDSFDPDAVERILGQLAQPPSRISRVPR
jgi:hypothetical protein